jgi:hypothetical protein
MFRIGLLLATGCAVVAAQDTWGGLNFGMTETEAQAALKGRATKSIRDVASEQPFWDSGFYAPIQVTDVKVSNIPGKANLLFDRKTKRLCRVNVNLDLASTSPVPPAMYESTITENLTGKYGRPVVDYHCDAEYCSAKWKDGQQVIDLAILRERGARGDRVPRLIGIVYTPASKPGDDI